MTNSNCGHCLGYFSVCSLKSAYLQQVEVMDKALLIEMEKDVKVGDTAEDNNGWELFDEAVSPNLDLK